MILTLAALMLPTYLSWAAETQTTSNPQALTLEKCLELAYTNNQDLKAAHQGVIVAQQELKQARGAFLPTVDYQFAQTNSDGKEGYNGLLTTTYPLYYGGKITNGYKIRKLGLDVALEKERQEKQKLTYSVKESFNKVWLAEEQLKVANASYENMAHHADQIEKLFKVGNTSKFELLRAQVQRDKLKPAVIKAQNGVDLAKLALATTVGVKKDASFNIAFEPDKVTLPETSNASLETALNSAYQNRSELKQIQLAAQIAEAQVAITKGDRKPLVGLKGSYQGAGADLQPGDWAKTWTLSLGVSGNLFNATKGPEIKAGKAKVELQKIQEQASKDGIRLEVEQVLQNIKESLETAKSTQANIALSKEALRLTEVRFQAGMATTMDVKDAQLALDDALNGYYQSVAAYLTAIAKLDMVTGQSK